MEHLLARLIDRIHDVKEKKNRNVCTKNFREMLNDR
jgi:hypothetical protein